MKYVIRDRKRTAARGEKMRRRPYAPPSIEHLGNVRDTLRKTGLDHDNPRVHPKRP